MKVLSGNKKILPEVEDMIRKNTICIRKTIRKMPSVPEKPSVIRILIEK